MKRKQVRGQGRVFRPPGTRFWWIAFWRPGVGEVRESSKSEKQRDAVDLLTQRLQEIKDGTYVVDRKLTVSDLLVDVTTHYTNNGFRSLPSLAGYVAALTDDKTGIGATPAAQLTTRRIQRLVDDWKAEGVKPASINRRLAALRRAYQLAKDADPPRVQRVPRMPMQDESGNVRSGFFDRATFLRVLDAIPADGLADFVEWAFWTGMRRGEMAKLTWSDFDRETWWLILPGRITKNGEPKGIPVCTDEMRAIIGRRLAAHEKYPACDRIFFRVDADAAVSVGTFDKAWKTACRKAGCEGRLFHDLRRTGVRNLIRAGVPRAIAMQVSGHKTESVFERYNIVAPNELEEALHKLSRHVRTLPTDETTVDATDAVKPTSPTVH